MRRLGLSVIVLIALTALGATWAHYEIIVPYKGYSSPQVFVDIPRGTARAGIASILVKSGVVRSRMAFEAYSRWHQGANLQAGEYMFEQPVSARDVFWKIAAGKIYVHTIVVPEGWTMFDIADALSREGLCARDEFLRVARDPALIRDIAPHASTLEGFLFPSSYQFSRHATPEEIAGAMVARFRTVWGGLAVSGASAANADVERTVNLASLIERETPRPEERPLVASVFDNRLRLGYALQCDPTVQYALQRAGRPERYLRPQDLLFASAYNTYLHRGLPPGPIANPGEASLRAALAPARTTYLYFVANTQGGHFFSSTLAQHNRNVALYRRLLAKPQAGLSDPPQPGPAGWP